LVAEDLESSIFVGACCGVGGGRYEHETDDDGEAGDLVVEIYISVTSQDTRLFNWAYNAGWESQAPVHVLVEEYDERSEQAMSCHSSDDGPMDRTLDKTKYQRPSSMDISSCL